MTTSVPNTPQELMDLNSKEPVTPESVLDNFLELSYEEQDNFIYKLLCGSLKFHKFLLQKSKEGDKNLPNTQKLIEDCLRLEMCVTLYSEVQ